MQSVFPFINRSPGSWSETIGWIIILPKCAPHLLYIQIRSILSRQNKFTWLYDTSQRLQYQVHNPSNILNHLGLFQEIILFVLWGKPHGISCNLHWVIIKIIQNLTSLSCWNSCSSERKFFKKKNFLWS